MNKDKYIGLFIFRARLSSSCVQCCSSTPARRSWDFSISASKGSIVAVRSARCSTKRLACHGNGKKECAR
eukprot:91079-Pelagomonas_calceolata.AAC.1